MIKRQFKGEHERIFYLDNYFNPRNIFIREIRGDYKKYFDGKIIAETKRETDIILIADIDSTFSESTSANCNSLHLD